MSDELRPTACPFCGASLRQLGSGMQYRHDGGRTDCILAGLTVHDCDMPHWNRRASPAPGAVTITDAMVEAAARARINTDGPDSWGLMHEDWRKREREYVRAALAAALGARREK